MCKRSPAEDLRLLIEYQPEHITLNQKTIPHGYEPVFEETLRMAGYVFETSAGDEKTYKKVIA